MFLCDVLLEYLEHYLELLLYLIVFDFIINSHNHADSELISVHFNISGHSVFSYE